VTLSIRNEFFELSEKKLEGKVQGIISNVSLEINDANIFLFVDVSL